MTYPLISDNIGVQACYEFLRGNGESHKMSEMLAFRQPPRAQTDREFFEGFGTLEKQFRGDEQIRDRVIKIAINNGYKPNANDVYLSSLANYPGDPEAFVPATGGRGHIKSVCEKRGWECDGTVKTKYQEPREEPKSNPMAKDIMAKKIKESHKRSPSSKKMDQGELRHNIVKNHGFTKDRK